MSEKNIIPGEHGQSFKVAKNSVVTIKDLEGEQVIDLIAFIAPDLKEYLSVTHTRFYNRRLYLKEGDKLFSNLQSPIAEIVEDTVGIHNMTAPSCDPHFYRNFGGSSTHRSCFSNFSELLRKYGINHWEVPDPLNIFQDTPNLYHTDPRDKSELSLGRAASKSGDYIKLRFLTDAIFAVSACPFTMFGFNGGKSTSIEVIID